MGPKLACLVQGVSEGLWSTTVTEARDELEVLPSNVERMLRKQVSALQVWPLVSPFPCMECLKSLKHPAQETVSP